MAWEDYKDLDVTREEEIVKEDEKTQRIELQRKSPFDKPINKGGELIGLKKNTLTDSL